MYGLSWRIEEEWCSVTLQGYESLKRIIQAAGTYPRKPSLSGSIMHRVIDGFMIQGKLSTELQAYSVLINTNVQ